MKSKWGILVFEVEKFTTISITGTLVHSHPVTDQLKWSHYEEYLFLKKRSSPLSPLRELWYTLTPLRISWNEVTMRNTCFWRIEVHRCLHYGNFQLWDTFTLLRISWNEVTMRNTCFWRRDAHHCLHYRSFGTPHPVTDQLKWSYDEDYLYLKKRYTSQELWYTFTTLWISLNEVTMNINFRWIRYVLVKDCFHYMNTGTVHFHHIVDQLKQSCNEDYLFLKKRGPPLIFVSIKASHQFLVHRYRWGCRQDKCLWKHLSGSCLPYCGGFSWDMCP